MLTAPSCQKVKLDYTAENGQVLVSKLQALFSRIETPKVAGSKITVVINLLSPAQRPLAVTVNLSDF